MTAPESAILLYIVCASPAEAKAIGLKAVESRHAACANILPGMSSIYRWEGRVETTAETILLLKTRAALFESCAALVRASHSYATPCIIALPIAQGTPDYLNWLTAQTA